MSDSVIVSAFVVAYLLLSWAVLTGGTGQESQAAPFRHVTEQAATERVTPHRAPVALTPRAAQARERALVFQRYRQRRSAEAPWFAHLAREMGLSLALGVAS